MATDRSRQHYWKQNQRLIGLLLAIWFLVSFVFAIFMARTLYGIRLGELPLSFWWAQQGSMFVFVLLIFVYAWRMDRLDREHGVAEGGPPEPTDAPDRPETAS